MNQGMSGAGGLIGGAALGTAFNVLYDVLGKLITKNVMFAPHLKLIKSRLDSLAPLLKDIEKSNKKSDLSDEELGNLKEELEKGIQLLRKCEKTQWWSVAKRYKYTNKLIEWDESLQQHLKILNVEGIRDVKDTAVTVKTIEEAVRRIELNENTIGLYNSSSSGSVTLDIGSQDVNDEVSEHRHKMRATSSEWIPLLTNLGLEILSAAFDQVSSPRKPHYALIGMLLAIVAMLACIWELVHNGIKEGVVLRRKGKLWWFYYPSPSNMLYGTFPKMFGLLLAIVQCICSAVQYYYLCRHATNPIKLSPVPVVFVFCLVVLKLVEHRRYTVDGTLENRA
ncbi:uncharacterized protein LOC125473209 isoform X2 [Pyrus x bretschneideri]|uniref:uncharacterized protein LOC125473209 isoform X2 n=1 Tax=Pyrus x bretschneideri TaxID=225117 RepID=UPI00202EBDF7|nr:uncharacterized protein LOC125473209 isoform X2 [Pyrus x bretschneideri]